MGTINWFEIPVSNMDRAAKFYGELVGGPLRRETFQEIPHAFLGDPASGVGGALVKDPHNKPSADGNVVYLGSADIEGAIARVRPLGAEVLVPKTDIGEHGHIAVLRDSEGNRIGLHTPRA
jgi:predicted enzyme related to lactoylglutathione lyase